MNEHGPSSEEVVALWAIGAIGGVFLWRALRWFVSGVRTPNPWGPEIDEQIEREDAVPVCTRCLEPYPPEAHFCPDCGAPVDPLVNYSPYLYIFSVGHLFRIGSFGAYRLNGLTVFGFVLASFFLTQGLGALLWPARWILDWLFPQVLDSFGWGIPFLVPLLVYWVLIAANVQRQNRPSETVPPIITPTE